MVHNYWFDSKRKNKLKKWSHNAGLQNNCSNIISLKNKFKRRPLILSVKNNFYKSEYYKNKQ
jgi:hypothetical protein